MRLKVRHMLMGACVAAAAVSCTSELVDEDLAGGNGTDGISFVVADDYTRGGSFGNRPGSSTRATVTTGQNINTQGNAFAVFGEMTSLDSSKSIVLFNGEEVKHNGSDWTYSNLRYWFTDYEYSFVALYPKTISGLSSLTYENNRLAFTYNLPENYRNNEDILTATHRRKLSSGNTGDVSFNLQHIMSRLNFTIQVEKNSAESIVIDQFSMTGIVNQASYQISPANLGSNDETDEYYDGTWVLARQQKGVLFDRSFSDFGALVPGEEKQLFKSDEDPLIIIPQDVTEDVVVNIKYHYASEENVIKEGSAKLFTVANVSHNGVWSQGKSYNYTISLGGNDFVIFSAPEVTDWKPAEGGNYIITD